MNHLFILLLSSIIQASMHGWCQTSSDSWIDFSRRKKEQNRKETYVKCTTPLRFFLQSSTIKTYQNISHKDRISHIDCVISSYLYR